MEDNNGQSRLPLPLETAAPSRIRASGPILLLAVVFVIGSFLAWYFTWFGRGLSDADISQYLIDYQRPRHVQHALLQVQQRIERGDSSARQWYPQILQLAAHSETEYRLTAAWVMGADNKFDEFHQALKKLLVDPEPIVRRNAALALVRFNDSSGREEIRKMLEPFTVQATTSGLLISSLSSGAQVSRGTLLARIRQAESSIVELRSPLTGVVEKVLVQNGSNISQGDGLVLLESDEATVWESLRALALVGATEDSAIVERYTIGRSEKIQQQARSTLNTIQTRQAK